MVAGGWPLVISWGRLVDHLSAANQDEDSSEECNIDRLILIHHWNLQSSHQSIRIRDHREKEKEKEKEKKKEKERKRETSSDRVFIHYPLWRNIVSLFVTLELEKVLDVVFTCDQLILSAK